MQKPSQDRWQHLKHVLSKSKHISWINFSTEVDLRGDTHFPVDYRNGRVDPSGPISLSLLLSFPLSSYISLLHGSARPLLPWQQGLVQHGEDYGERKMKKKERERRVHLQSSTSSRNPEDIYWERRREMSLSLTSFLKRTYLSFSINTDLPFCLFLSYLHAPFFYLFLLFPQFSFFNIFHYQSPFPLLSFLCPSFFFFFLNFVCPCLFASFTPWNELVMTVV